MPMNQNQTNDHYETTGYLSAMTFRISIDIKSVLLLYLILRHSSPSTVKCCFCSPLILMIPNRSGLVISVETSFRFVQNTCTLDRRQSYIPRRSPEALFQPQPTKIEHWVICTLRCDIGSAYYLTLLCIDYFPSYDMHFPSALSSRSRILNWTIPNPSSSVL